MTKKDFELIAGTLRSVTPNPLQRNYMDRREQWERECYSFADALASTNPRFDRERFLLACGVTP